MCGLLHLCLVNREIEIFIYGFLVGVLEEHLKNFVHFWSYIYLKVTVSFIRSFLPLGKVNRKCCLNKTIA